MRNHPAFEKLCACFARLPGVGRRSSERMAFGLITAPDNLLAEFIAAMQNASEHLCCCRLCGGLTVQSRNPCRLCSDTQRDDGLLCVVEDPSDIIRIERAGGYNGRYHALMGRLSPMEGTGAKDLRIDALLRRMEAGAFREVILALNSNVESDATAGYIRSRLAGRNLVITRPATGIPAGGGLAYADSITLSSALQARQPY